MKPTNGILPAITIPTVFGSELSGEVILLLPMLQVILSLRKYVAIWLHGEFNKIRSKPAIFQACPVLWPEPNPHHPTTYISQPDNNSMRYCKFIPDPLFLSYKSNNQHINLKVYGNQDH